MTEAAEPTTFTTDAEMGATEDGDEEIERIHMKIAEMEAQLKEEAEAVEASKEDGDVGNDDASVYIGQVDYSATPEDLHAHFAECGTVKRVTILCDKWTGHPKGYAYMEFEDISSVEKAVQLHESVFNGRKLKVLPKRANQPGLGKKGKGGGKAGKGGGKGYKVCQHGGGGADGRIGGGFMIASFLVFFSVFALLHPFLCVFFVSTQAGWWDPYAAFSPYGAAAGKGKGKKGWYAAGPRTRALLVLCCVSWLFCYSLHLRKTNVSVSRVQTPSL